MIDFQEPDELPSVFMAERHDGSQVGGVPALDILPDIRAGIATEIFMRQEIAVPLEIPFAHLFENTQGVVAMAIPEPRHRIGAVQPGPDRAIMVVAALETKGLGVVVGHGLAHSPGLFAPLV